jgi:hypothetical protein
VTASQPHKPVWSRLEPLGGRGSRRAERTSAQQRSAELYPLPRFFLSENAWTAISPAIRAAARRRCFAKDKGHCRIRGPRCRHSARCTGCAEELDHIIPVAEGGPVLDPDNHRSACVPCNRGRDRPMPVSVAGPSRSW